jgi:hypothetical protein
LRRRRRRHTTMNDPAIMDVLDGLHHCANERGSVFFVVVPLCAYPVEELAAGTEVEAEVEVVCGL